MRNTTKVFQILSTCPFQSIRAFSNHSYQSFYPEECANTPKRKEVKGIQETANMKIKILVTWLRKKTAWRSNYSQGHKIEIKTSMNQEWQKTGRWTINNCGEIPFVMSPSLWGRVIDGHSNIYITCVLHPEHQGIQHCHSLNQNEC